MKAVMLSIQPKWCELIASGKKTVEVRKTKPKIETPFKCYIYCTKGELLWKTKDRVFLDGKYNRLLDDLPDYLLDGAVIGEFVCRRIDTYPYNKNGYGIAEKHLLCTLSCIEEKELYHYLQGSKPYAWNISDLVIYDKPKELREFYVEGDCDCMNCKNCAWFDRGNGYNVEDDCNLAYKGASEHKSYKPIKRPFQSWGYVEELK